MPVVSGQEPNVVPENEDMQEGDSGSSSSYSPPVKPHKPSAKRAARTAVKTTINIARKILQVFAVMPLPIKIAIIALIAIIIMVVVIFKADAAESTKQMTTSINSVLKNNESVPEAAKLAFEESGSLIKLPLETIIQIYEYFAEEGNFSGVQIRENYSTILGTNEVKISEGSSTSTTVSGDMEGLVKKALELAEKGGKRYCMEHDRNVVETIEEIEKKQKFDCSSFVASLFKACLGIDVGGSTSEMYEKADAGNVDGWKVEIHSIQDGGMQPGDILICDTHAGIYVGDNMQVDHGGPGGSCGCSADWTGPKNREVSAKYTDYIRYTKQ